MRLFAIFALGLLVGLVVGFMIGKASAAPTRRNGADPKNPWA